MQHLKEKRGFTIIELLVVIAIIGLLAAVAAVALVSARQDARNKKRMADITQMATAVEAYIQQTGSAPVPGVLWQDFQKNIGTNLIILPKDPTNVELQAYYYCRSGELPVRYALMAPLENEDSIDGDIDGEIDYLTGECVSSTDGTKIHFDGVQPQFQNDCGGLNGKDDRFCQGGAR